MKKDVEKLGDDAVVETPEANETITPEVVKEVETKKSKKAVAESKQIEALRKELADKDNLLADKESQIEVLGALTKTKTRGEVIKEVQTPHGTIRFYNMKE